MCRDNLETALAKLPLLLSPKRELVEALLLGVGLLANTCLMCAIPLLNVGS
jgi:hypothetical protein